MDNYIEQLEKLTISFMDSIEICSYEEVEEFITKRQPIVDLINIELQNKEVSTEDQKDRIKRVLELDPVILRRMESLLLEAREWLYNRRQAATQRSAYESNLSPGSILMDRRK
ncbi:hypothetical protein SAMN04487896_2179 [Paenibacillus sp. ov031]|uniref:hypothetical protein n=1 Tax=Paenibacillus sp. ov031 TaxID=1761879 RepID=UPI00091F520B|nr:hypothetical protein [Paenibacillus sp. ov031]SHN67094.1 hypothetical protein SAMN04487896_2179 [Paenibacillus sp. ov031]